MIRDSSEFLAIPDDVDSPAPATAMMFFDFASTSRNADMFAEGVGVELLVMFYLYA